MQASWHGGRRAESGNGGRPVLGADPGQRPPRLGSWARPDSRGGGIAAEARLALAGSRLFPVGGDCSLAGPPVRGPDQRPGGGRVAAGALGGPGQAKARLSVAGRARVSRRFPIGALQPSRYGPDTLGWLQASRRPRSGLPRQLVARAEAVAGIELAGASEPSARKEALAGDRAALTNAVGHGVLAGRPGLDLESCGAEQLKARNSLCSRRLTTRAASGGRPNL